MSSAKIHTFSDRFMCLNTLVAAVGEETDTLEDVYEPFLLQLGFLTRTPKADRPPYALIST